MQVYRQTLGDAQAATDYTDVDMGFPGELARISVHYRLHLFRAS